LEVDVLVVGAGPAGSTTARFCAGGGADVLVIDRRREIGFPVQCGELLPDVGEMYTIFPESEQLEELFTVPSDLIAGESRSIDLVSPRGRAYRCAFRSQVLDRRAFDKHLAKLAVDAGARVETGVSFLGLRGGVAETTMGEVSAKVIVGADGPNSRTARAAGLQNPSLRYPAVTCQAKGEFDPAVKMLFGSVAPGGYAWTIPKRGGANIGLGFDPRAFKGTPREAFDRFVSGYDCTCESITMGIVPMSGPVPSTVKGNVLLVGDAAGQTMATNGGGIPTAMIAGRVAGRAIKAHLERGRKLEEYESGWRRVMLGPLTTSVRTRRMADLVFGSDLLLGAAMFLLGRRSLDRAIRCQRLVL
jgi:digeranylgeranylglycerophospholipid reductase